MIYLLKNKNSYFHINSVTLSLALKQRLGATRKWPMFSFVRLGDMALLQNKSNTALLAISYKRCLAALLIVSKS